MSRSGFLRDASAFWWVRPCAPCGARRGAEGSLVPRCAMSASADYSLERRLPEEGSVRIGHSLVKVPRLTAHDHFRYIPRT